MTESIGNAPELTDARWFPVDLHVPDRRYGFLHLSDEVIARSSFLDTRIEALLDAAQPMDAAAIPAELPRAPVGWLFHTSFCGSTLAARALHLPPHAVCLREPLILRRLGDARHMRWPIDDLLPSSIELLARPWHPQGAIVIKPTHGALNIAADLMTATPDSRAIVVTSSLEDFLISNLKKTPESQAKIPALAERALVAGHFHLRLPPTALQPPDLLCAAALQWAAQRELVLDVIETIGRDRVRILDMQAMLDDFFESMWACSQWLQLPMPRTALADHVVAVASRNAKATDTPYGPERRAKEAAIVTDMYSAALARALDWARQWLLPSMRSAARDTPNPWAHP